MIKTYLQGAILLTCRKEKMVSIVGAGTVEDIHGLLPDDYKQYKEETIRKALNSLVKDEYMGKGLMIGNKNTYYLTDKGYRETYKLTKKAGEIQYV